MMSMLTIQSHGQFSPFNTTCNPSLLSPSPSKVSLVTRFEILICGYEGEAGSHPMLVSTSITSCEHGDMLLYEWA